MPANVPQKTYSDGLTNRFVVYRVYNITAADTIQTSTEFWNVTAAYFIPSTGAVAAAAATITVKTTVTPAGALANDDGYLMVYGTGIQQ